MSFGCQMDCGKATVVPMLLLVEINLVEIAKYLPIYLVDDLRQRVLWNVCWMEHGSEEICWFKNDLGFNQIHERGVHSMSLKPGQWYIRVRDDYFRSRVADLLSPIYVKDNWGDSAHCRRVCEATVDCMAFAYHLNHSWCFFKSCFDLATITWEASTNSEYEFHYFDRDSCTNADGDDAATSTTRRRSLQ
ncbi:hypothetical protein CYMTET_28126, partial [Cymbomonas tetramitiformis]